MLGQALATAQKRGKVHRNVAHLAEMPRTAPPPEQRSLTVEQAKAFLAAAEGDPTEAFVITGLMLGIAPRGTPRPALDGHRPRRANAAGPGMA